MLSSLVRPLSTTVSQGERPAVGLVSCSHAISSSRVTYRLEGDSCRAKPFPRLVRQRDASARCPSERDDTRRPHGAGARRHTVKPRRPRARSPSVVALCVCPSSPGVRVGGKDAGAHDALAPGSASFLQGPESKYIRLLEPLSSVTAVDLRSRCHESSHDSQRRPSVALLRHT